MDTRRLTDDLTVSPQIAPEDLAELARQGYRAVIANRPDAEIGPDLAAERMAAAADRAGLAFHYLPFVPGQMTAAMVEDFARIRREAGGPVHAYCRSGTRSATLWALGEAGRRPADEILGTAGDAGYDLSGIAPMLQARG